MFEMVIYAHPTSGVTICHCLNWGLVAYAWPTSSNDWLASIDGHHRLIVANKKVALSGLGRNGYEKRR